MDISGPDVYKRQGELHTHLVRNLVKRNQIRSVLILNGNTESNVLHTHLTQLFQCTIATLITILQTANLIIGLLQTLNGNTNADMW